MRDGYVFISSSTRSRNPTQSYIIQVPLVKSKRKATPVTLPLLDPVAKLLAYTDSKMAKTDTDSTNVKEIPSDQRETTSFVRMRFIFFDFEQLAMEEMGRIQLEQALNSSKRHVNLLTELQDKFEKEVKDLCSNIMDTAHEKCTDYVRDRKFTEKTLRDDLDHGKKVSFTILSLFYPSQTKKIEKMYRNNNNCAMRSND